MSGLELVAYTQTGLDILPYMLSIVVGAGLGGGLISVSASSLLVLHSLSPRIMSALRSLLAVPILQPAAL
jgi:hypothetical protein